MQSFLARPSSFGRLLAAGMALAAALAPFWPAQATGPAASPNGIFIPDFWDPSTSMEKPDTAALRVIRFLTDDDYPPFDFVAPDGTLTGFNVDLARAICQELNVACTVQPRRWDTILDALEEGRGDAAIASIGITEAARQKVDFTSPYYRTPARFVTRRNSTIADATVQALAGKTVGVEKATAHEAFLRTFFPGVNVKPYDNAAALRSALRSGAVEAIFGDGVTLALWLNGTDAGNCCEFKGGPFTERRYFGDGVGIAVRKNNVALRQALDYALQRLAARGVYADLYLKYFPVGFF
jgi:polar amino acid transport system substrate-binding protein